MSSPHFLAKVTRRLYVLDRLALVFACSKNDATYFGLFWPIFLVYFLALLFLYSLDLDLGD
jgi:hypothetical protein